MINKEAEARGRQFSPKIRCSVSVNYKNGKWVGSISIGEEYYETDPYNTKDGATSELLGCINSLGGQCQEIEDNLNRHL